MKGHYQQSEMADDEMREIFVIHISDRGLASRIIRNSHTSTTTKYPIKNGKRRLPVDCPVPQLKSRTDWKINSSSGISKRGEVKGRSLSPKLERQMGRHKESWQTTPDTHMWEPP